MAKRKCKIEELPIVLKEIFDELQDGTNEATKEGIIKVSNEAVKQLKAGGPYESHGGKEEYRKGWTSQKVSESNTKVRVTIYNAKKPGLVHLLEKGHLIANGTVRKAESVKAYKHVEPVQDAIDKTIVNAIEVSMK